MSSLLLQGQSATKIRVWADELPIEASLPQFLVTNSRVIRGVGSSAKHNLVAVEIFRGFGASFHYALLGGVFQKSIHRDFKITIPVEDPRSTLLFNESLAGELDEVSVGGGYEFSQSIFDSIEALDAQTLPAGKLTITCMARGAVGSAPMVFSGLARALVRMITRSDLEGSFDDIMNLIAE